MDEAVREKFQLSSTLELHQIHTGSATAISLIMISTMRSRLTNRVRTLRPPCKKMSTQATEPKRDIVGIAFFSGICLMSLGLGAWQVQRYNWKVNLIETIKNSATEPPTVIGECQSQAEFCEKTKKLLGQRVLLTGKFDHTREVFLGLRTAPSSLTGGPAQGMASNPQGYFVVTPLIRPDGCTVFVNRGWVPRKMYSHQQWQLPPESEGKDQDPPTKDASYPLQDSWDRPEGEVSLVTVMSEGEKAGTFSPVNALNTNILIWLEPASLLRASTAPSFNKEIEEVFEVGTEAEREGSFKESGLASLGSSKEQQELLVETMVIADALGADTPDADEKQEVFPFAKPLAQLQEQIVAPETHVVYAVTWFSLAAAGLVMTFFKFRRGGAGGLRKRK